ncbi:MAG: PIN domain-containing protein [archaeon]|nr:PIN domain-containing protein [Candidatus ainarchaeum sp.]
MNLVVDSNIIFSALISPKGKTAELIFLSDLTLFSTETLEKELIEHKIEIMKKAKLIESDFEQLYVFLKSKINFIEGEELDPFIDLVKEICPDKDDVSFFAVALAKNFPLWSNDKLLKTQNVVKVINTFELVKMLS